MTLQPVTVVKVVEAPSQETSVGDILLGAVGLVGFVLVAAAVVGVIAGAVFFLIRRARGPRDDPRDYQLSLTTRWAAEKPPNGPKQA